MSDTHQTYVLGEHPELAPPKTEVGVWGWMYHNLFSSPLNNFLTFFGIFLVWIIFPPLIDWLIISADWTGETRQDCSREGACWVYIKVWLKQLMYGRYPTEDLWRVNTMYIIGGIGLAWLIWPNLKFKGWVGVFMIFVFPVICYFMFSGGSFGLERIETPLWGGLFLTLVIASVGIVASLPIGVVLALGRQSKKMPVVKAICVGFIELWRGVPLITVLFMASVMFPLFMPEGVHFDKLIRALVGVMLFAAAYMAEVVRGGLQAIPKGQYEAAESLGLSYWKLMSLIILPQALKIVIPGIVNTFIGLFKDTTLVLIIGLFDFLGMAQAVATNPDWLGFAVEGYVFVAFGFWVFCFGMSRYSQHLERKLHTGN